MLIAAQMLLKRSVELFGKFEWAWRYFKTVFTTWQFAASGICAVASVITWMFILKRYPFSLAYPLTGVSYIIALVAALLIFQETIPATRWIGVLIMLIGIFFICK